MKEILKSLEGKHITIILNSAPRPIGGVLERIGDDFIVIDPQSSKTEKFIVSINAIASMRVNQSGELNEVQRQRR